MAIVEYEISLSSDFKISTDDTLEVYKGSNKAVRVIVTSDTYVGSTNDLYINFQREVGAILSRRKMTWDTENSQWYYDLEYKETLKVGTLKISVALTELNVDTYLYTSNELDLECLESGAKVISIENEYVENLVGGTTNQYLGKNSDSETDFSFQTIQSDQVDDSSSANKFVTASEKTQITTNATNIATNTNNIATNTRDIATNTGDIEANTENIATNTSDISTNATNIAKKVDKEYNTDDNKNTITNGSEQIIENIHKTSGSVDGLSRITLNKNQVLIEAVENITDSVALKINQYGIYIRKSEAGDFYEILTTNNIIDNLTSTSTTDVLSAYQGKLLKDAIDALSGSLIPQGNWDADTNTPDISGTTATGYYWVVSVAGATDLGEITDWGLNDWAVKSASGWLKIDNSEKVTSVNGKIGDVVLNADAINDTSTTKKFATEEKLTQIVTNTTAIASLTKELTIVETMDSLVKWNSSENKDKLDLFIAKPQKYNLTFKPLEFITQEIYSLQEYTSSFGIRTFYFKNKLSYATSGTVTYIKNTISCLTYSTVTDTVTESEYTLYLPNSDTLAIKFDEETASYAVNAYVVYQSLLYKCHTAITVAGSWTGATNWTQVNITDELNDGLATKIDLLKEDLRYLNTSAMLADQTNQKNGGLYLASDSLYVYLGVATGTIDDYQAVGGRHGNLRDLDYASAGHTGFVPSTRKVNDKALTDDIVLTQTYTTTLPTTSGGASDWQAVTGGYELAKTISGLTIYDSIVSVADDDTIWTDNELNATITANTLTFFVSSLPSAEVGLTLTITKSINGGTL